MNPETWVMMDTRQRKETTNKKTHKAKKKTKTKTKTKTKKQKNKKQKIPTKKIVQVIKCFLF